MWSDYRARGASGGIYLRHLIVVGIEFALTGREWGRSLFDKVFAICALLFFAPILVLVSILIFVFEGGPLFFAHRRVGKNGRPFRCYKFRTMVCDAEARLEQILESDPAARAQWEATQKLDDDPRVTAIGTFLRRTSLDELPQFWNVILGDMAIVGPRPIVASEVSHYGNHFCEYVSVKPGITGLWQVNGRCNTTYESRVAMDVEYVHNRCFTGDLRIILKTVTIVVSGDGAR
ncbi:sugar transferase [Aliiruegeria lutimaris]|uniref:Sugar transferase involved in LPS biosynthesis (Colanic, teichoic acid) n=1 Tax=Aliiruegeria lutimaris TaxID=571298 RepID=A0A1G9P0S9_9RHOB|nr:sugar transferase [Aliiruegeria lutimaris]SDL92163.1 Sugar transferase involved in LPS biosynthesis (colanic, teichoic acid) [Aliiruegeria lutimaris]